MHAEVVRTWRVSLLRVTDVLTGCKHCVQVYFSQFRKTPFGMLRLDPQDAGPGYRNVIGIPGGVNSPLFRVLQVRLRCRPLPASQLVENAFALSVSQ